MVRSFSVDFAFKTNKMNKCTKQPRNGLKLLFNENSVETGPGQLHPTVMHGLTMKAGQLFCDVQLTKEIDPNHGPTLVVPSGVRRQIGVPE